MDFCKLSHGFVKIILSNLLPEFFKIDRWNSLSCNIDLSSCYIYILHSAKPSLKLKFDHDLKLVEYSTSAVDLN